MKWSQEALKDELSPTTLVVSYRPLRKKCMLFSNKLVLLPQHCLLTQQQLQPMRSCITQQMKSHHFWCPPMYSCPKQPLLTPFFPLYKQALLLWSLGLPMIPHSLPILPTMPVCQLMPTMGSRQRGLEWEPEWREVQSRAVSVVAV